MTKKATRLLKSAGIILLLAVITGGIIGYKMYTKPHRNVTDADAVAIEAAQLAAQYEDNEAEANSNYLDKVLEISGEVSEITKNQKEENVITFKGTDMSGVTCTIEKDMPQSVTKGQKIILKGICTGYLSDVILVRCAFKNK